MKVKVLRDKCIGCGTCATVAPKFFKLDKENLSVFIGKGNDEKVLLAAQSCPMRAIEIKRKNGK
jgi:ferredoxin